MWKVLLNVFLVGICCWINACSIVNWINVPTLPTRLWWLSYFHSVPRFGGSHFFKLIMYHFELFVTHNITKFRKMKNVPFIQYLNHPWNWWSQKKQNLFTAVASKHVISIVSALAIPKGFWVMFANKIGQIEITSQLYGAVEVLTVIYRSWCFIFICEVGYNVKRVCL